MNIEDDDLINDVDNYINSALSHIDMFKKTFYNSKKSYLLDIAIVELGHASYLINNEHNNIDE